MAFRTNRGLVEPTVMFFGLTNSPTMFQSIMDHIFQDLINTRKVSVYIDDIVIHTKTLEEHRCITKEVLEILRVLRFNLVRVEIRELRPEVVAEGDEVLVHYRSRTNV